MKDWVRMWYQDLNLDEDRKKELSLLFQDHSLFSRKIQEIRMMPSVKFADNDVVAILVSEKFGISYYLMTDSVLSLFKKKTAQEMYTAFEQLTDYQESKLPLIGFQDGGLYKDIGNLLIKLHRLSEQTAL